MPRLVIHTFLHDCATPSPPRASAPGAGARQQNKNGAAANDAASGAILIMFLFCCLAWRGRCSIPALRVGPGPRRASHTARQTTAAARRQAQPSAPRYSGARAALRPTSGRPAAPAPLALDKQQLQPTARTPAPLPHQHCPRNRTAATPRQTTKQKLHHARPNLTARTPKKKPQKWKRTFGITPKVRHKWKLTTPPWKPLNNNFQTLPHRWKIPSFTRQKSKLSTHANSGAHRARNRGGQVSKARPSAYQRTNSPGNTANLTTSILTACMARPCELPAFFFKIGNSVTFHLHH